MSEAPQLIDLMLARKSVSALVEPGPSAEQIRTMLLAAGAVPDHGLLRPFRFLVVEADARGRFGDALAAAAVERMPGMPRAKLDSIRAKAFRSPSIIALVLSPKPGKVTIWEQSATTACAGYAIVLAAHALGIGAVWKSVPFTKGKAMSELLGLRDDEEMLGWIHLGQPAKVDDTPREPLPLEALTTVLTTEGCSPYR